MTGADAAATHPRVIPYFRPPNIDLGFAQIEPFGILTAAGLLFGTYMIARAAKLDGKDPKPVQDFVVFALIGGVIMGHLFHVLLYHPEELDKHPLQILRVWDGLSSTGGMIGGTLAVLLYFKWKGIKARDYMDAIALGITPGWGVARVGCFLVHDHPGRLTDFPLAVAFPGGARHDLGLYEAVILFAISGLIWTLRKRNTLRGDLLPFTVLVYGFCRFWLDFLRADDLAYVDARYLGLTPAQYVAIAFMIYGGISLVLRARRGGPRGTPTEAPPGKASQKKRKRAATA